MFRLSRRKLALVTAAVFVLVPSSSAFAGRLIATGHDADLHCMFGSPDSCQYFNHAVDYVRATAPDASKPVLVLDKGSLEAKTSLDRAGIPNVVMDPQSAAWRDAVLVPSSYSAIVVASDSSCGGCDLNGYYGTPDSDAINARTEAIHDFFNQGGGVLALSGASHGNGFTNTYYAFLPIPVGGRNVSPPFTLTSLGTLIGWTSAQANCCATHNSFAVPPAGGALQVAETDRSGNAETLVAEGTIVSGGGDGGGDVIVPPAPSDTTAPTVTPTVSGTEGDNGYYTSDVRVSWTTNDGESAITTPACGDTVISSDTEGQTVSCTATSAGGTTTRSVTVKRDATAPAITADRTPANDAGWNNGDVTVSYHCSDAGSGLASCSADDTLSGEGAGQSATGTARDNAGNTASATVDHINIDTTPPAVSYSGNAGTYTVADSVNITCSATDALSGIRTNGCQDVVGEAYTFALGSNSFSSSATDRAGNTGTGSVSFQVKADAGSVCALTQRWVSKAGVASSMCAKLDAAQASAARGNSKSKDGQLAAYRNELDAQSGKAIAADKAAILSALSKTL